MAKYALGDSSAEIERLSIQASLFEPNTKQVLLRAGLKKGMRCIDVGCGTGHVTRLIGEIVGKGGKVLGIDINKRYIDYCKRQNAQKQVDYLCDDISNSKLVKEASFDIVFSRFMFVHLRSKKEALRSMIHLAKKDGKVIVQELDHAPDSWMSYPRRESVQKLRKSYVHIVRKLGGDALAGRKLYKMFIDEGLEPDMECHSPCVMGGRKPYNVLGWRLAESLRPHIISLDLMSVKEYEKLLCDLKEMADDHNIFVTYARLFSVIGRKN